MNNPIGDETKYVKLEALNHFCFFKLTRPCQRCTRVKNPGQRIRNVFFSKILIWCWEMFFGFLLYLGFIGFLNKFWKIFLGSPVLCLLLFPLFASKQWQNRQNIYHYILKFNSIYHYILKFNSSVLILNSFIKMADFTFFFEKM